MSVSGGASSHVQPDAFKVVRLARTPSHFGPWRASAMLALDSDRHFGGFTGAAQMRKSSLFRPIPQAEAGETIPGGKGTFRRVYAAASGLARPVGESH